jgi:META domain
MLDVTYEYVPPSSIASIQHHQKTMDSTTLFIFIIASLLAKSMALRNYEGLYQLTKVIDDIVGEIPLPDGEYTIRIVPAKGVVNQYDISIKLGNSMGASAVVSDSDNGSLEDAVSISGVRSTMMMPPPELFKVEVAISDVLPAATSIDLEGNLLLIKGSKGSLQASRKI